ncbi:MAG TPA: hypothetical protein VL400_15265 [Polyangiaceae bacterium]|jgi:hypothetical protein|nr:hypothetical protein [Polyangiaceae bacterium]
MDPYQNPYLPPGGAAPEGGFPVHPYFVQKLQGNVKILGGIQIGLGVIGGLGVIASNAMLGSMSTNPVQKQMNDIFHTGTIGTWMDASQYVGVALAIILVVAGVSLVRLRPLGRPLSIAHATLAAVMVVVGLYMNIVYVFPALDDFARQGGVVAEAGARGGKIGGYVGSIIGLVLPAFELYLMTRPGIRQALGLAPLV